MSRKPRTPAEEMNNLQEQFDNFDSQVKSMTTDSMNLAPVKETEQQTKLSQKELQKAPDIVIKPKRTISGKDKFNEKYRSDWEFAKQNVQFVAENKEIIGEKIEMWTKPFAGVPAEFWEIPVNKPIWAPRYVAEQITRAKYHKLSMNESVPTHSDGMAQYTGQLIVESTVSRLDAKPVNQGRSIFTGASSF